MIIAHAVGVEVPVVRWMAGVLGAMPILTGNYAGKIRPNAVYGVRTPWTLADPEVWARTHRLYGWLSVLLGLGLVGVAVAGAAAPAASFMMFASIAALVVVSVLHSCLISRRQPGASH